MKFISVKVFESGRNNSKLLLLKSVLLGILSLKWITGVYGAVNAVVVVYWKWPTAIIAL